MAKLVMLLYVMSYIVVLLGRGLPASSVFFFHPVLVRSAVQSSFMAHPSPASFEDRGRVYTTMNSMELSSVESCTPSISVDVPLIDW